MADHKDEIPPIPVPPPGASTMPPVEPPPAAPTPPTAPEAPTPPVEPAPLTPPPAPDPYTAAPATPPAAGYSPPTPGYGQPGYAQQSYAPAPPGPPQGLSIASMVTGIAGAFLSLFGWGFLPALAAVITGHIAQKRQPYARPFWLTGIITGYVGLGISLIWGLLVLIFFIAAIGSASYLR